MNNIKLKARGKINLGLDVCGVRDDGYHQVRMVMQTVGLYDRIIIEKKKESGIDIVTNIPYIPVNENNLVYKAADMLMKEFHITEGVSIDLKKFIPVAAGMAGGSSDAASVLFGVNRLFELGLSNRDLMQRGVKIGADVPYCIMRGTALAEGIGEELSRLPAMPQTHIIIAKPAINVSTKVVYDKLDLDGVKNHPDIDGIIAALKEQDIYKLAAKMGNVLEEVTIPMYPVIDKIKETMLVNGAIGAMMSGSGPTVFGLFDSKDKAMNTLQLLKNGQDARQAYITEAFNI